LSTDTIEVLLGWTPASLTAGLERMAAEAAFRQDFGDLLEPAA
jgi:hypothetical protein